MPTLYVTDEVKKQLDSLCHAEHRAICDEIEFLVMARVKGLSSQVEEKAVDHEKD